MESFGAIWGHLGLSDAIWVHLGPFGAIWKHLGIDVWAAGAVNKFGHSIAVWAAWTLSKFEPFIVFGSGWGSHEIDFYIVLHNTDQQQQLQQQSGTLGGAALAVNTIFCVNTAQLWVFW